MSLIGEYEESYLRCVRCSKRMVLQLGQNADTGELEEHHWCLSCEYAYTGKWRRPKAITPLSEEEQLRRRYRAMGWPREEVEDQVDVIMWERRKAS